MPEIPKPSLIQPLKPLELPGIDSARQILATFPDINPFQQENPTKEAIVTMTARELLKATELLLADRKLTGDDFTKANTEISAAFDSLLASREVIVRCEISRGAGRESERALQNGYNLLVDMLNRQDGSQMEIIGAVLGVLGAVLAIAK